MGEMADLIRNAGLEGSTEPGSGIPQAQYVEDLPGDYEDISGYDPMDYGDEDEDEDDGPDEVAEDTTNFATSFRNGPAIPETRQPAKAQPREEAPKGREKGNVHAKLRVVERENRIMQERLNRLIEAITPKPVEEEELEQEIVPFEQDPLTHMVSKLDQVSKKVDKQNQDQKLTREKQEFLRNLEGADQRAAEIAEKIGEDNWVEAMEYLANVRIEDYLERNPDKTRDEANHIIGAAVLKEKVFLESQGRNSAELYLKDAIRFGFRPSSLRQKEVAPVVKAPDKPAARSPRDEIRSANNKGAGTRTTASMNGAPAKQKLSAKGVVGMKESDFRDLVDEVEKERGRGGALKLSDFILPNS